MAGDRLWRNHCCPTAARAPGNRTGGYSFLQVLQAKKRADERTRTAYPCSLRVISQVLQGFAQVGKSRIVKQVSFLYLALCCTVLRSQWYQSGINGTLLSTEQSLPRLAIGGLYRMLYVDFGVSPFHALG
jgi:hypothetical protein